RRRIPSISGASIAHLSGPANQCNPAMADSRQVRNGFKGAALIIGLYQIRLQPDTVSHQQYNRNVCLSQPLALCQGKLTRSLIQNNAVDSLREQKVEIVG